jgi:hypothetical protein
MDEARERGRGTDEGPDATDKVGLGRVVEDHRQPAGEPRPVTPDHPEDEVEEASEDSFPASDPPPSASASGR